MKIYADTSALLAWFHPADEFAVVVTSWCRARAPEFSWNQLLRAELRHNLRKLSGSYAAVAWQAYRASETTKRLRLTVQSPHQIFEWGDELSARHASGSVAGTWDFMHVAAAQHARVQAFITCDQAQAELARLAGLRGTRLFSH